jgi:hypothetical protein
MGTSEQLEHKAGKEIPRGSREEDLYLRMLLAVFT